LHEGHAGRRGRHARSSEHAGQARAALMPRVKRSVAARKKRRKVLGQAKGYWGLKKSSYRYAKEQVDHSLTYAYRDRNNKKLRLVRKLRDRGWRDKLGLFVAEGEDLVDAARDAGFEAVDVLVAGENVEPALLAEVSTLGHPPRVVGVFRRREQTGTADVTLALWRVADPGNVGTLVRSADAFGAGAMLSDGCADPFGPKALRAAMGSTFRVPLLEFELRNAAA